MKNSGFLKKMSLLLLIFSVFFAVNTVSAETAPSTVTIDKTKTSQADEYGEDWLAFIKDNDGNWEESIKLPKQYVTVNGESRAAYCMEKQGTPYQVGAWGDDAYTLNKISEQTKYAYLYLIENGTAAKLGVTEDQAYYVTQVALWWYQDLANGVSDSEEGNLPATFKKASLEATNYTDQYKLYSKIKNLANNALSAKKTSLTIALTGSNSMNYSSDRTKLTSTITIDTDEPVSNIYNVTISSKSGFGDESGVLSRNGKTITLNLPVSRLNSLTGNITVTASVKRSTYKTYLYKTSATKPLDRYDYQNLLVPIKYDEAIGTGKTVSFTRTHVKVEKVDEDNKPVSGAKLKLTDSTGKTFTWTTDGNAHDVYDLAPGTVTLEEIETPDGFVTMIKQTKTLKAGETLEFKAINYKVNIRIVKQDENGKNLSGAKMRFSCTSGYSKEFTTTNEYTYINGTDAKGNKISPGDTCTLEELKAPDGYVLNKEKVTRKISSTSSADANTFTMKNALNEIEISKQDATTGEELPGAHLVLKDVVTGKVIEEWDSTDKVHIVKGLKDGTYSLSETIAPKGYIKTTTAVVFDVKDGKVDKPVVMVNKPTTVTFPKKDKDTSEIIAGAELVLKNKNGEVIERWISTTEPYVVERLIIGEEYTVEEVTAPEGYDKAEPITFTVEGTDKVQVVTIYDSLTIVPVPDTGSFTSMMIYVVGGVILVSGIAGTYFYIRKRKSEQF